jgi:ParB family chromosome partitioning protein
MAKVKKSELGMGIRALLNNVEEEVKVHPEEVVRELSHSVAMIAIDTIEVNPWQPRKEFDASALEELVSSIKVHGLIQPLTVRRLSADSYQLISGERRLRATKLAGLTEVPAYVRLANDQEMLEMALVENIQRQDLNAIEIAITYQRLIDECSLTHETMADRVGKQRSTVSNYLRLLKLPPEIQSSLKRNLLTMGHARALAGVNDPAFQLMLHKRVVEENLSVRQLEELISFQQQNKKPQPKPESDPELRRITDKLSSFFGSKVVLKRNNKGIGQIVIAFKSDKDLNSIIDRIDS